MPLPPEVLEGIKKGIDEAEENIKSISDVISDLRATGIDASKQEEALTGVKEDLRKLRLFYDRQTKRLPGEHSSSD